MNRQSTEDFQDCETTLYDIAMIDECRMHVSKAIECPKRE